jgi:hypothetical protein
LRVRVRPALRLVQNALVSGNLAGLLSIVVAAVCGKIEHGRAAPPVNAISHILWGGHPARHAQQTPKNTAIGFVIHQLASVFWALFFEQLFGRQALRDAKMAWLGGAAIASAAYFTDYHIVPQRVRPGFEECLSGRSLFCIYAALAAGFAAATGITRVSRPSSKTPR